jgi:hypothetical protein
MARVISGSNELTVMKGMMLPMVYSLSLEAGA